jgi:hypothetical protein
MAQFGGERHLGKMFGLNQGPASPTPLYAGSELGLSIGTIEDKYPRTVDFLRALPAPWTDGEILQRTMPSLMHTEAHLWGQQVLGANEAHDCPIVWPSGKWYTNMELRCGQHITRGQGARINFGTGGTHIALDATNWKSIYGAQNNGIKIVFTTWNYAGEDNLSAFPFAVGGGAEWGHHTVFEDMYIDGQEPDGFRDPARVTMGIMLFSPGEQSAVRRCRIQHFNDFGVLISHNPADTYIDGLTAFHNHVASIGMRGCALSNNTFTRISADFVPYILFQFRGGSDVFGTGAYLPHALSSNPGGTVNWYGFKSEDSCGRAGYPGFTGASSSIGKGNMLARVTGRTYLNVYGGTANTYVGKAASLVEVVDDFDEGFGGTPLDNSHVELNNVFTNRYGYYIHDWSGEKVFEANQLSTFNKPTSIRWCANENSRLAYYHNGKGQANAPSATATFHGRQPFINDGEAVAFNYNLAPTHGYDPVDGTNYP